MKRDNNHECAKVKVVTEKEIWFYEYIDICLNRDDKMWHPAKKDQEWKKKINEINLAFIYNHIDYVHFGEPLKKVLELYEKALEEKNKEIKELEELIEIKDQTYIEMLDIKNNEIDELIEQIKKMKCCDICKYEVLNRKGIKDIQYLCEDCKNYSNWELKE